ncbi:MAG TPA: phosphoribosyltransferase family protein [Thermoanaerobaculia bacterium]|nr:phosphoribosyltransferase family protein [Thermoanaerobaculia bacterium]
MSHSVYGSDPSGVTPSVRGRLLHLLLPACCSGCGVPLPAASELGLCGGCRSALRPVSRREVCAACALPLAAAELPQGWRCARCRQRPPAFDRLLALWLYEAPLDSVIQGLKFRRLDYLGAHLARSLAAELAGELAGFDVVAPVPLHWRRCFARGYNQAACIGRPLAGLLALPFARLLARRRATPPQTSLHRDDRLENLRRAFHVRRPRRVRGLRVLLVDDVATTGATLDAAAAALKKAGAAAVTALVAARTPARG